MSIPVDRERSDASHDPTLAIARFALTEAQLEIFYAALKEYDRRVDRLALQFPEATIPLAAAKYASDRVLCTIIGLLSEAKTV
jgi:hypothetical protein